MPPHSIGSGTLSFGLVSIPVKMFTAASAGGVSFNQLHEKCGGRIKQQLICPSCNNQVVERTSLVKGYEFAKEQYVRFTEDELKDTALHVWANIHGLTSLLVARPNMPWPDLERFVDDHLAYCLAAHLR